MIFKEKAVSHGYETLTQKTEVWSKDFNFNANDPLEPDTENHLEENIDISFWSFF